MLDGEGINALAARRRLGAADIAQVQVDGAYWQFAQTPPGPLDRLATARIDIPYPWVEGETHHLVFLTSTGAAFEHTDRSRGHADPGAVRGRP